MTIKVKKNPLDKFETSSRVSKVLVIDGRSFKKYNKILTIIFPKEKTPNPIIIIFQKSFFTDNFI